MSGKAVKFISRNALSRIGRGLALATVVSCALGAGTPLLMAAAPDSNATRINTTRAQTDNSNSRNKKSNSQQAVALGTVSLAQQESGFKLFGKSGLTLNHSSVMSQKVYASPNPQFDRSYSYSFGMGLRLSENYFSGLSFSLAHQPNALDTREQLKLKNTSLEFSRNPIALNGGYSLTPGLGIRLPVGREVVDRESLRFGLAPSATLALPPLWNGSKLGTSYTVSGTYNNHKYTQHSSGNPNIRWGVNHSLKLAYPIVKSVILSAGANHGLAWTTLGTTREYVGHSESLSWQVSPNAAVSVGHASQGELYALDGVVYDFSFLSERNSVVFGRLNLSI